MKIKDLEWWIVGILGLTAFILAIIGFNTLFLNAGVDRNFLDLAFHAMKMFGMEFADDYKSPLPISLEIARWLGPGVLLYAATKAIIFFIKKELKYFSAKFFNNHIIVTSLNEKTKYLVNDLLNNGRKVIVVPETEDSDEISIQGNADITILEGEFSNTKFLKKIAAHKAKYFVFAGNDEANISNAILTYNFLINNRLKKKQIIFTHAADDRKFRELSELNFFEEITKLNSKNKNCEIRIFSGNERISRNIFNSFAPDIFIPVNKINDEQIHTAVIGSNDLALSMIIRLARLGNFANLKKMKITLYYEGSQMLDNLNYSYPNLDKIVDLIPIETRLDYLTPDLIEKSNNDHPFASIYIVCEDDELSGKVLNTLSKVDSKNELKVILALENPDGILNRWYNSELLDNINLYKINITERSFTEESIISEKTDELAKKVHEFYLPSPEKRDPEKSSHKEWELLPVDFKNQNREQADHIYVKLRALGCKAVSFNSPEPEFKIDRKSEMFEILSEMEHNRWMAHMYLSGWQFGETRNDKRKIHTDLIPYPDLSEQVKDWDRNAIENIPKLLSLVNLKIVKS